MTGKPPPPTPPAAALADDLLVAVEGLPPRDRACPEVAAALFELLAAEPPTLAEVTALAQARARRRW